MFNFNSTPGFETLLAHAGEQDPILGAIATPVFDTASFALADFEAHEHVASHIDSTPYYTRGYNPTVARLEEKLAAVEGGQAALAFNNGMAAISTTVLTLLRDGGHIVVSDRVFATSELWFGEDLPAFGLEVTFADFTDLDSVRGAIQPNTRALFFEEFTNPELKVLDLPALVHLGHNLGLTVIVDNTFASPALFRPLEHGVDLVIQSATKYMSGHGRVLAGSVSGRAEVIAEVAERRRRMGTNITPHNAAAILEGIKTLDLRVERASKSALTLATLADEHSATSTVNYPGLPSSHDHEMAKQLTKGRFGGMFSFSLADPTRKAAVYDAFKLIVRATSLGDVVSLVDSAEKPDVLRISVGIESVEDLAADMTRALDAALG